MAPKPCLTCRRPMTGPGSRHPQCGQRPERSTAERNRRAATVTGWRAEHGDWCPGYDRDGHPSNDLCADHVIPVGAGGSEHGPLGVLCRPCNSRKRNRLT